MRGSSPRMTSPFYFGQSFLFLQMLRKERHAARPGDVGAGLVVARPLVAMKAVLRAGVNKDLDVGPFCPDDLDIAEWDSGVLLAEVQLRRHLRLAGGKAHDSPAVIADRSR